MSELVERVKVALREVPDINGVTDADGEARAAIAAVIEFLYLEAGRSVCPGAAHEYLSAAFLEKQLVAKE